MSLFIKYLKKLMKNNFFEAQRLRFVYTDMGKALPMHKYNLNGVN